VAVVCSTEVIHVTAALLANRSASVRKLNGRIAADRIIQFFFSILLILKLADNSQLSQSFC
jgi:hypothetical protein